MFGERALLKNEPRAATVQVTSETAEAPCRVPSGVAVADYVLSQCVCVCVCVFVCVCVCVCMYVCVCVRSRTPAVV